MKRSVLSSIFLLYLLPVAAQEADQATVLALHREKFEWLINKNYESLDNLLDKDVQYIHSNGWIQTKQEVLDDLRSGKLNYASVTVEEANVRLIGRTAIVTGTGLFKGLMADSTPFELKLLYTEVYSRSGSRWKLHSRQAVKVP